MKRRYIDIPELREAYREGKNIIETINRKYGLNTNTSETIEISYDLQAGSYMAYFKDHTDYAKRFTAEQAACVKDAFPDGETILDCGCGELTNSALLFSKLNGGGYKKFFCFDLSWSRVFLGKDFFCEMFRQRSRNKRPASSRTWRISRSLIIRSTS